MPAGSVSSRRNWRECSAKPDDWSEVRSEAIVILFSEHVTSSSIFTHKPKTEPRSEVPAAKPPDLH